eukprot:1154236-Pelagomonas_calceolata.AAC.13
MAGKEGLGKGRGGKGREGKGGVQKCIVSKSSMAEHYILKPNAHESRSMAQQAEGVAHTAFLVFKVANGSHLTSAHLVFTLRLSYTHPPAHLAQTLLLVLLTPALNHLCLHVTKYMEFSNVLAIARSRTLYEAIEVDLETRAPRKPPHAASSYANMSGALISTKYGGGQNGSRKLPCCAGQWWLGNCHVAIGSGDEAIVKLHMAVVAAGKSMGMSWQQS